MKKVILGTLVCAASLMAADFNLKACASCHGANFEKSALGKSKIVANLSVAEIETALIGYKNGTYGGPMKGMMKGQVAKYDEATLKAMAAAIKK